MKKAPHSKVITIVGNVGSGKSTLMTIIKNNFDISTVNADNLFQVSDPFAKPFLADMNRWSFTNELWLTHERAKILRSALSKKHSDLVFVDSGLLMSWVYTYSHLLVGNITQQEWDFYKELYDHLTADILYKGMVIRLKYSMETLLTRIQKRGRDYELAFYSREYLAQLELGLNALQDKLCEKNVHVCTIEEDKIQDFESRQIDKENMLTLVKDLI